MSALPITRLLASPPSRVVSCEILFEGRDLLTLTKAQMQKVRGKEIAMVFQDPMTSLNPVLTTGQQIGEALVAHLGLRSNGVWRGVIMRATVIDAG